MIDKQFDDILKRKLNEMIDTSDSNWSSFASKLEQAESLDMHDEGSFDNAIKQKLAGLAVVDDLSDWNTFQQMLEQDQITDQMLDDKVSMEMNRMRAPYRHDHWELLHDQLEYRKTRNRNVIGYKIIELSLLFLFLLSANNYIKYLPSTFEVEKPKIYASIDEQTKSDYRVNQIQFSNKLDAEVSMDAEERELISSSTPTPVILADSEVYITKEVAPTEVDSKQENLRSLEAHSIASNPISTSFLGGKTSNVISDNNSNNVGLASKGIEANVHSISNLNLLVNTEEKFSLPLDYNESLSKESRQSITVYVGIDNNLVNSPFDDVYDDQRFRTYGVGYSAGVDYGLKHGNKEWSIGLGYSNRSYEPRIIDELTGDAIVNLLQEHVELDIFSIAAGLRFKIKETDNWSFDFGIGASANILVHSDYEVEKVSILRNGDFAKGRGNPPVKPLHDGVNEGGSLKENIYFTSDISFGLQRKLNTNTSFTIRPEYSVHSFSDGVGPNNDLINNLSLNLGLKYNL